MVVVPGGYSQGKMLPIRQHLHRTERFPVSSHWPVCWTEPCLLLSGSFPSEFDCLYPSGPLPNVGANHRIEDHKWCSQFLADTVKLDTGTVPASAEVLLPPCIWAKPSFSGSQTKTSFYRRTHFGGKEPLWIISSFALLGHPQWGNALTLGQSWS